jgi:orotate phosphoribosyltransferase
LKSAGEWEPRRQKLVEELGLVLVKTGALKFGTFRLTTGKLSSYYIDLRAIPSFPGVFRGVLDTYLEFLETAVGVDRFDAIGAIPTAGLTYASVVAYRLEKPMVYVRKGARQHGLMKLIEGVMTPGWRVLILDDLVTTGSSILNAAEAIRTEGGQVNQAVVLIDRLEGGRAALQAQGIELKALTTILELSSILYDRGQITEEQLAAITAQVESGKKEGGSGA